MLMKSTSCVCGVCVFDVFCYTLELLMVFSHFSLHKIENSHSVSHKTFERNHLIVELLRLSSEVKVPTETMLD